MAQTASFEEPRGNAAVRWALIALGVLLALFLVWFIYISVTGVHGVAVKQEAPPTISPLLPPPPPPPPPPKEVVKQETPTEKPTPSPSPEPAKTPDAPAPMQMNAEAQSGAGSIAAGSGQGGGSPGGTGTCITDCGGGAPQGLNDGLYRQYLRSALQAAVLRDARVKKLSFTADFDIVITPDGRIERARVRRSTGNSQRDDDLLSILQTITGLRKPPVSSRYPVTINIQGRRPL